jgi:glutaredoxin
MSKEFFQKNNVQYQEFNVASDDRAREEMIQKSHQMGVPVIDIDGEIFVGFNRNEIARALGVQ